MRGDGGANTPTAAMIQVGHGILLFTPKVADAWYKSWIYVTCNLFSNPELRDSYHLQPAGVAHIRQSRPDCGLSLSHFTDCGLGLSCPTKTIETLSVVPESKLLEPRCSSQGRCCQHTLHPTPYTLHLEPPCTAVRPVRRELRPGEGASRSSVSGTTYNILKNFVCEAAQTKATIWALTVFYVPLPQAAVSISTLSDVSG